MKLCSNCNTQNHASAFRCKYCNHIIGKLNDPVKAAEKAKKANKAYYTKGNASASLYILGGVFSFIGTIITVYLTVNYINVPILYHSVLFLGITFLILGITSGKYPYWSILIGTTIYTLLALLVVITIGFNFWFFVFFIAFGSYLYVGLFKIKRNTKVNHQDILDA